MRQFSTSGASADRLVALGWTMRLAATPASSAGTMVPRALVNGADLKNSGRRCLTPGPSYADSSWEPGSTLEQHVIAGWARISTGVQHPVAFSKRFRSFATISMWPAQWVTVSTTVRRTSFLSRFKL
jgi:hypothetical protein